jgi:glucoamylase
MTAPTSGTAPGHPGIEARWTSSAKSGVGTATGSRSRVWFTISHGIVDEVYYPRVDQANTRDLGLIVTDGATYFSEEKRDAHSEVAALGDGVPGYQLTNRSADDRYRIIKTIVTDPERDVLLQEIQFEPIRGRLGDYHLYALLAPHLGNQGSANDGWVGDYKGVPMLFAQRGGCALALACSASFAAASCGYVGISDGWQELHAHKRIVQRYARASDGNIALTGEIDLTRCNGRFVLALAFGETPTEAGQDARASLLQDFADVKAAFVSGWTRTHNEPETHDSASVATKEYLLSVAMLRTHEDKGHPGAIIASLSIPWGNAKGDHDLGGYHVVWPRDLVESASALLAAGHADSARQSLRYLMCTQEEDGHWPQNMWLDGRAYWTGTQMDETGLPILLADLLFRHDALGTLRPWPMVRRAASYLARYGPVTPEDRWEEDGGYSPFTLAVEIAALLASADFAALEGDMATARYLRETADIWNASIDRWTYVSGTDLARRVGVDGYYVRIAPPNDDRTDPSAARFVVLKNHPRAESHLEYNALVSPDALALVRFGLRAADDPRILNTVRVIDAMLRTQMPTGPAWHRYNEDGYGEHADGSPFDGTGVGRVWPLLAGERGHYELAAGRVAEAKCMLQAMQRQTSSGGLIPEQIWDEADIPARELFTGHPSGSAMPLVWAHAEYVKLSRSLHDRRVFDMPPQTVQRYLERRHPTRRVAWRFNNKLHRMPPGKILRIELLAAATVHWSADDWQTTHDVNAIDTTLGIWYVDLPTRDVSAGSRVKFTFHWSEAGRWERTDFTVSVEA